MTTHAPLTHAQVADLVHRLSPSRADATRDEWVRVGMAIHDALPGDDGFSLFDVFSRQSPKYTPGNIRATWRTFKPGSVTVATLIAMANEDDPQGTRSASVAVPEDPNDYPAAHGCSWSDFAAWGATRGRFTWKGKTYDGIRFPEGASARWRLFGCSDGKWIPEQTGMPPALWGLSEARALAEQTGQPLVLVNGQASVIACHAHRMAAFCIPGGEGKIAGALERGLLAELQLAWSGPIVVLLDGDEAGRKAARAVAPILRSAGYTVSMKDVGPGMDGADHCRLHNGTSVAALQSLPELDTTPAIAEPTNGAERPPRFAIRNLDDLAAVQPPSWLLPNEIVSHAFNLIYGASGSGKTFYAIDRALRVAASGRRVCYIATEDLAGLKIRVAAWRADHPSADVRGFTWLGMDEGLNLADARQVDDLVATLSPLGFDLITLDTLREAHAGDENSSQDMAAVNRAIQRLIRETGAALDVVHHSGVNDGRERGSTALAANCDLKLKVSNDDGVVVVSCEKLRNGTPFTPRYYRISQVTLTDSHEPVGVLRESSQTVVRDAPLTQAQRKILDTLALSIFATTGAKTSQISDATGIPAPSMYRALSALKNREYISQSTKGDPYTITPTGRAALDPDYIVAELEDSHDSHDDESQQDAQLSPTLTNSHDSHESPTLLSLTLTTPRGESDESGEREKREDASGPPHEPLAHVPWPSVETYLRMGNPDRILQIARGMWRADPIWVLEEAARRFPEHAALVAVALQPDDSSFDERE